MFADLHAPRTPPTLDATSFVHSEFLDSSGNPVNQTYTSSEFYTPSPRNNKINQESPESSYSTDNEKPSLDLTSQSFRMSFGTSNDSDVDSDPEMFITAKSALEQSSCCSDSGVNVSDGSSYRPADHESFEEQEEDLIVPVFNVTSPTTDPEHSTGGSSENERQPPSGYSTPRSKGKSECSTPRKLSVASHGNLLHEMSWDNFDIDRNKFETAEEYEKYMAHVRAQADLKQKSGELIGDYSAVSDSETVLINNDHSTDETADSQDVTILEDSMSTHNEMSDKDNVYETSVEDSEINFPTEADYPTDMSFPADQIEGDLKSPREDESTEIDGLPITESLALLAETKKLYSALEEKTSLLEEKYFSPEKMKCALSDPMGSFVLEEEEMHAHEEQERPASGQKYSVMCEPQQVPIDEQEKQLGHGLDKPEETEDSAEQQTGLISRSIEFFEQLSQSSSSSPSPKKLDERFMKGTPPKTPTKAQRLKKTRRPSRPRSNEETSSQATDEISERDPLIHSSSIDEECFDIPQVMAESIAPAAQCPKSPPKLLPKPKSPSIKSNFPNDCENADFSELVAQDEALEETNSDSMAEGLTKQRLDAIVPCKITRRSHHKSGTSLSQPSIETGTTEVSRTTASTDSTAFLRESVEKLRFEIDEIVNDCSESFGTSLDTDRHNFSDSTYDQSLQNNSNVMDDTLVSDTGEILSSESGISNPVILDEYCSDPEAAASELEELFKSYLPIEAEDRGTVGIEVTYYSDKSDSEDIHYVECEICESPYEENTPVIEPEEVPDINSVLILSNSNVKDSHRLDNLVCEGVSVPSDAECDSPHLIEYLSVTSIEDVIPVVETTDAVEKVDCLQTDVLSDCQSVTSASKYILDEEDEIENIVSVADVESVSEFLASDSEDFTDILRQEMSSPPRSQIAEFCRTSPISQNVHVESADGEEGSKSCINSSGSCDKTFVLDDLSFSALTDSKLNEKSEPTSNLANDPEDATCEGDSWSPSESSESVRKPLTRKPSIVDDLMDRYLSPPEDLDFEMEAIDHVPGCENSPEVNIERIEQVIEAESEREQGLEIAGKVLSSGDLESSASCPSSELSDATNSPGDFIQHDKLPQAAGVSPAAGVEKESDTHSDTDELNVFQHPSYPSTEPETETDTRDTSSPMPTEHETESESESTFGSPDPRYGSPFAIPKPDNSYGAAYDDLETSESETESELSEYETLSGNYQNLCSRLEKLKTCFKRDKFNRILDLEQDEATGLTLYEIKLPCIAEEDDCEEIPSDQINKMMPHVSTLNFYSYDIGYGHNMVHFVAFLGSGCTKR